MYWIQSENVGHFEAQGADMVITLVSLGERVV